MYTPINPSFTILKWGLKRSKLYRHVFVLKQGFKLLQNPQFIIAFGITSPCGKCNDLLNIKNSSTLDNLFLLNLMHWAYSALQIMLLSYDQS